MDITLRKDVLDALGVEKLTLFGYTEDKVRWKKELEIDLSGLTKLASRKLRDLLVSVKHLPRVPARISDVEAWLAVLEGANSVRCKKIVNFAPMLKQYLKDAPKHWLYERRTDSDVFQPYYVSHIHYEPPKIRDGYTSRPFVTMTLHWEELGGYHQATEMFHTEDCEDLTVARALSVKGYQVESAEMITSHQANHKRYVAIHDKIGLQFTAVGVAEEEADEDRDWWSRKAKIYLERNGVPSRVVVDVLSESDNAKSKDRRPPNGDFWKAETCDYEGAETDDDTDLKPGEEDEDEQTEVADVPLAPSLMCFDLKRHTRLKIYVDQLTEYRYRTDLAEKLILPPEVTGLVNMLVAHKGGFKDIVGDKGGGAVILCAGLPGTGKTLTSEVYSESMCRPLYSVQCSQLGVDPSALEEELLKTFARAHRWNAILLLDEADVYVARRGSDLTQNAIVGVFLRVLEYYGGVLFLTTNRAELVDDAIASRCLARIDYRIPSPSDQVRIWHTLSATAGLPISAAEIDKVVKKFPALSGRDVKNMLKLASMVAAANGAPITAKLIESVKMFKPTQDPEQ